MDDAVTANSNTIEELGGKVQNGFNVLGRRVNNAGAHAAALAALNPVAEDDSKLGFAAGMGSYHNAKAGAIGLFYRPSDRYQISLGGTTGGGEHMYNLGLSVALDKNVGGPFANKKAMIREIVRLRDERDIRDEQMKDLLEENRAQAEVLMVQNEKIAELENSRAEQDAKIDALMKMMQDIQKGKKTE